MHLNNIEIPRSSRRSTRAKVTAVPPLPENLAFTEWAVACLRKYLDRAGLGHYRVFYNYILDCEMDDIDEHLKSLGESAAWEPLSVVTGGAEGLAAVQIKGNGTARGQEPGCLNLRRHEIVLARWYWVDAAEDQLVHVWLCAAPTFDHYARLREEFQRLQRSRSDPEWRIVRNGGPGERVPRVSQSPDALLLDNRVRERIEIEVVRFFCPEVAEMYSSLRVPYRRGVLMHGPPGNGKTSLIRFIGSQLPEIPGLILRPSAKFDTDLMAAIIRRWTNQAPAILVIEDLDWLLKQIDVSMFLNLVDGIESAATGGLLLLATTNHPEKLDPAINNRPGRFDVVIEIPAPDLPLRTEYLRKNLPDVSAGIRERIAIDADGLAFAHLQEIVRMSGLIAINAGRTARIDEDVLRAARTVREAYDDAVRGFRGKPDMPFGLGHLHQKRRDNS
jgi:hypothetical protein